ADFSPKNLLVFSGGLLMVDFETGHYGDPAFDLGFFLSHVVLKACYHIPRHAGLLELTEGFRRAYDERVVRRIPAGELADLWSRGIQNFAACAWARLDGKSPVEYLTEPDRRDCLRRLCLAVFEEQPREWSQASTMCQRAFARQASGNAS